MPELAEVETLKRYLKPRISGKKIVQYNQYRANLRYQINDAISENIEGSSILTVIRRAKFLHINLDNDYVLTFHLGMSGRITCKPEDYDRQKHDHVIIQLGDETNLVFNDARRFGMLYGCHKDELASQDFLKNMGPEPLEEEFNAAYLKDVLAKKKASIKTLLMDSRIVVGVGNIYAAESLFMSGIHPSKPASELTNKQIELLVLSIKRVLERAIESGGTTLKDFVNGDNNPGYFQQKLSVYGRKGDLCTVCKGKIEQIKQAGRSSFFCPQCQKY